MEMRYFWLLDQEAQKMFQFLYQPGAENLADYPSKAHTGAGHQHVRPYYLHQDDSPHELPRASKPSARQGCAEILGDPYDKKVPLPRIPNSRPLGSRHNTHVGQYCHTGNSALGQFCLSDNGAVGQFSQQYRNTPRTATSGPLWPASNLQRSIAFLDTHTKIMSNFPLQPCTY